MDPPLCGVPELHLDYAFFRDRKGDKNTATVLVIKERSKSGVAAHVVPKKGSGGGFIVKQFERDIRKFGHRHKVLLRSDNEPAMKDLLNKVSALRAPETIIEHSPVGDSKANGRAERAVQAVEKQVRVLKLSTEEHFGVFSVLHPCFPWLVLHSADVITKFKVHPDGLTSYEKIKGRKYTGLMLEFATTVLYKVSAKVQGGLMQARWLKGIWLGKRFGTEEHLIGTTEGTIVRSAAVKPHPEIAWDSELFDAIRGTPWNPTCRPVAGEVVPEAQVPPLPRVVIPRSELEVPEPRRAKITRACIRRFWILRQLLQVSRT
jgi:hypothetical protein